MLTARQLASSSSNSKIAETLVNDQVRLIDESIKTTHEAGYDRINYELPANFIINKMSKADAQTLIYSEILMKYKLPESKGGKGFDNVKITLGAKNILHIGWCNSMTASEKSQRLQFIESCRN